MKHSKYKLENEIFFLILPKYNITQIQNSNIGIVNAVRKKFIYLHKLKAHFQLKRYCSEFILTLAFIWLQSSFLFQHGKKNYEDVHHSPPHASVITGNILITIINHLFLASNSTFITDSKYLRTIQIFQNLNKHYYYLISTTSVIWQIDTDFSPFHSLDMLPSPIRLEHLKLIH